MTHYLIKKIQRISYNNNRETLIFCSSDKEKAEFKLKECNEQLELNKTKLNRKYELFNLLQSELKSRLPTIKLIEKPTLCRCNCKNCTVNIDLDDKIKKIDQQNIELQKQYLATSSKIKRDIINEFSIEDKQLLGFREIGYHSISFEMIEVTNQDPFPSQKSKTDPLNDYSFKKWLSSC